MAEFFSGPEIAAAYTQFTFLDRSTPEGSASVENSKRLVEILGADFGKDPKERNLFNEDYVKHVRARMERLTPFLPAFKAWAKQFSQDRSAAGASNAEINAEMCIKATEMIAPIEIDTPSLQQKRAGRPKKFPGSGFLRHYRQS